MNKIFAFMLVSICLFASSLSTIAVANTATQTQTAVRKAQLPANAMTFIKTYFPKQTISRFSFGEDSDSLVYTVKLNDGTELKFDAKGVWQEVEMKKGFVPVAIIPAKISEYIKSNHPGLRVIKIEKQSKRCIEVELEGDIELTFDANGRLMEFLD